MKVAFLEAPKLMQIRDMPDPTCGDDDVLIKVKVVGICGSDLNYYVNGGSVISKIRYPHILGHEVSGEVVCCGKNVRNIRIGDRVSVEPGVPCGRCDICLSGKYNLCSSISFMSTPIYRPYSEGAFCEYIVRPADYVYKLIDNMTYEQGALMEPLAVGLHAVEQSRIPLGGTALVLGCGPIALTVILALAVRGIYDIYAVDNVMSRLHFADNFNVRKAFSEIGEAEVAEIYEQTRGHGIDAIFDTTTYMPLVNNSLKAIAKSGSLTMIGIPHEDEINIDYRSLFLNQATLYTSFRYANKFPLAIKLTGNGLIDISKIVTHRYVFEDLPLAMNKALTKGDGEVLEKVVIHF